MSGRPQVATRSAERKIDADMMTRIPIFPVSRNQRAMRYYDYGHEQTSTAASISSYVYSANGMFDPDITGVGHQPMGFDQLFLFYNQATVVKSRIKVTLVNETAVPMRVVLYASPVASPLSDRQQLIENGECKTAMISGLASGGKSNITVLTMELDVAAYFGRKGRGDIVNDITLTTTAAANPTEQVYFIISSWNPVNSTTVTCGFDAILEYDAVFTEPKKLTTS